MQDNFGIIVWAINIESAFVTSYRLIGNDHGDRRANASTILPSDPRIF